MFCEDDLLPMSALNQLLFCERRCALIHIEGLWAENTFTIEGRHLHEKAHDPRAVETRGGVRIVRALPLRCLRLGLVGKADVVEFHPVPSQARVDGASAPHAPGDFAGIDRPRAGPGRPFPIEYKRGKPKPDDSDRVQLCAQALALEEMLGVAVPAGAIYYGRTRRRLEVPLTPDLRRFTEETAARLHRLVRSGRTPRAARQPQCDRCSLLHLCLPDATRARASAARYLQLVLQKTAHEPPSEDLGS
jgi:CRISPR-associated exonuclease Cas4